MFRPATAAGCLLLLQLVTVVRPDCQPTLSTVSGPFAPKGQLCKDQLLFNEQFDQLNTALWKHDVKLGGSNGEFQWYTDSPRNSYTKNGVLYLQPTLTTDVIPDLSKCNIQLANCTDSGWHCGRTCSATDIAPPIQSALINTANTFNFKYGRVVISAKMPSGKWLWPALWFLPTFNKYGNWPLSGEIDLVESRGNDNLKDGSGVNTGAEQFGTTLHFGTAYYNDAWWASHASVNTAPGQGFDADFHEYGMEWTPDHIQLLLDGQVKATLPTGDGYFKKGNFQGDNPWAAAGKDAPFDQEFYFILNNAVGGTNGYFPDNVDNKPWQNGAGNQWLDFWNGRGDWLPTWNFDNNAQRNAALQVNFVRLYAL